MTRTVKLGVAAVAALVGLAACASNNPSTGSYTPVPGATLHDRPVDHAQATAGKVLFERHGCYTCHAFGRRLAGPDLNGVANGRTQEWLRKWFADTDAMIEGDPIGQALVEAWKGVRMPNFRLSQRDADALIQFMAQESARSSQRGGD